MINCVPPDTSGNGLWEEAYSSFETPQQEITKFIKRLRKLGIDQWSRDTTIVEIFCGRGNGLHALAELGFTHIEGADLSASLLAQYQGPAQCYVCDCRHLPFHKSTKDAMIVQGGLHHLYGLPEDLEQTLSETHRVLSDDGLLVVIEPWLTPFLSFVHGVCRNRLARQLSGKINALATMIEHEQKTYEQWLSQPQMILGVFDQYFYPEHCSFSWGKFMFVGRKKNLPNTHNPQ